MIELLDYRLNRKQLLTPGKPVTEKLKNSDEFLTNLEEMKEILAVDGVGLAATQVNWPIQLFMLCIDKDDNKIEPEIFINPKIKTYSKNKIKMEEGCLSFWGLYLKICDRKLLPGTTKHLMEATTKRLHLDFMLGLFNMK